MRARASAGIAALMLLLAFAGAATTGCSATIASASSGGDFSTPRGTLNAFFGSALRKDFSATYQAYDQSYRDKVGEAEYVQHRAQAAPLSAYSIVSVSQQGATASADVRLTYASIGAGGASRTVLVHESLVNQNGSWRIRVW